MRKLQQVKVTLENGKKKSSDKIGDVKKVIDSAAEHLVLEGKAALKDPANQKGVKILTIWEDQGEIKKTAKKD